MIKPVVYGYNICVGEVSLARRVSREAPHELHLSLTTVDRMAERLVRGLFSAQTKVYGSRLVDRHARLWKWIGIVRVDDHTLWLRTRWERADPAGVTASRLARLRGA